MINRFEEFITNFSLLQKHVRKLKDENMKMFSLKGSHVMCLFHLMQHPEGLTLSELNDLCVEDKAATSRTVSYLKKNGYITQSLNKNEKNYNAHLTLTKEGMEIPQSFGNLLKPIMSAATKDFSLEEQALFLKLLKRLSENLTEFTEESK